VSDSTISFQATDENSGVSEILYSQDNGNTWTQYTEPFEVHPIPGGADIVIEYFSIDKTGNTELVKTLTIPAPPKPAETLVVSNNPSVHNSGGIILIQKPDFP